MCVQVVKVFTVDSAATKAEVKLHIYILIMLISYDSVSQRSHALFPGGHSAVGEQVPNLADQTFYSLRIYTFKQIN